jgi:hypothetical protein
MLALGIQIYIFLNIIFDTQSELTRLAASTLMTPLLPLPFALDLKRIFRLHFPFDLAWAV